MKIIWLNIAINLVQPVNWMVTLKTKIQKKISAQY